MKCLVCFILVFSLSVAQDCPLPANADIETALTALLLNAYGSQSYSPNITGSVQYVCQAQGNIINTYTEVSLIATYTPNPGEAEASTRILSMGCSSGTWSGITQDGLDPPPASVVDAPPRTNCYQCREAFGGDTRCRVTNTPPVIEASDTFMITVGETALYTLRITDPGDTISVTIDGEFPHTLDEDGSIWTLN
uniref:Uncharacterized protein n=1 Tax=Amphimedon queenslandica TaxID=400682 RepID=A0A1X7SZF0_AMPQE